MRQLSQRSGDVALAPFDAMGGADQGGPTGQGWQNAGDHRLEHGGDAGHDIDVFQLEPRCRRHGIVDQRGIIGDTRHAQTGGVQLCRAFGVVVGQNGAGILTHIDMLVERSGDAIGGDVIMGRPDAAAGEHAVIDARQFLHGSNDCAVFIPHHTDFFQVDPDAGQLPRQMVHV